MKSSEKVHIFLNIYFWSNQENLLALNYVWNKRFEGSNHVYEGFINQFRFDQKN